MDENVRTDKRGSIGRELSSALKLLATVALATLGAYLFRRSAGVLAMFPIYTAICLASSFIDVGTATRAAVFGVSVFIFNTVEQGDMRVTATFTALAVFAAVALGHGVSRLVKGKKKLYGTAVIVVGFVASAVLNAFLIGMPFKALDADKTISAYIDESYPPEIGFLQIDEDSPAATVGRTNVYYDLFSGSYAVDLVCSAFPTEGGSVTVAPGGMISDGLAVILGDKLSEAHRMAVTDVLREAFPRGDFTIYPDGIRGFPSRELLSGEGELFVNAINYTIRVGGVQTVGEFRSSVRGYAEKLDGSGVGYGRIRFESGIGAWYRQSETIVSGAHPRGSLFRGEPGLKTIGTGYAFDLFFSKFAS